MTELPDLIARLEKATEGLVFTSESDYPLKPFTWHQHEQWTPEALLKALHYPDDTPVQTVDLDYFFRNATHDQDWHSPAEQHTVARFRALIKLLREQLHDITVYRVGSINIAVYIVGRTSAGGYAGLTTTVVET